MYKDSLREVWVWDYNPGEWLHRWILPKLLGLGLLKPWEHMLYRSKIVELRMISLETWFGVVCVLGFWSLFDHLFKGLITDVTISPSLTNHLPRVLYPDTIPLEMRIAMCRFGGFQHSEHCTSWFILPWICVSVFNITWCLQSEVGGKGTINKRFFNSIAYWQTSENFKQVNSVWICHPLNWQIRKWTIPTLASLS